MGSSPEHNATRRDECSSELRRFQCNTCQRRFNRREHMQRHENTHRNHKPFHCTLCQYSCRRRDLLHRHTKLTHPKRPAEDAQSNSNDAHTHAHRPSMLQYETYSPPGDTDHVPHAPVDAICAPPHEMPPPLPYTTSEAEHPSVNALALDAPPLLDAGPNPRPFDFSYLDNVCLPPVCDQVGFYPGLSTNDPFLSPIFNIESCQTDQDHMDQRMTRGISQYASAESAIPAVDSERQNVNFASFVKVSPDKWQWLSAQVAHFSHVLPADYQLPPRHAISCYLHGFMTGFHPHFPILHPQTLIFKEMAPELILALAAVGSQYCLESHQGRKLFPIARLISMEQLQNRDLDKDTGLSSSPNQQLWPWNQYPASIPGSINHERVESPLREPMLDNRDNRDGVETMQALFFLMAMATWSGEDRTLVRQAIATQSLLAMLVRLHGLSEHAAMTPTTWEEWARAESARRTKLIIFCFFNLHSIVFNLPSPLMVSDMQLRLPCGEAEWKALDIVSWKKLNASSAPQPLFHDCIAALFQPRDVTPLFSSLGGHVLIHALLQRIISVKHSIGLQNFENQMIPGLYSGLQQALKKWQNGWEQNPESSYSPLDKYGPIAFNSRALYHLAHIRLAMDIGPARSLLEKSPSQIAKRLHEGPRLQRNPHLLLAARHAVAALCSPVQMGVHFVGRAPSWSVMHAVCSLEYAYALNQFLQIVTVPGLPLEDEEQALLATIKEALCEVETSTPSGDPKFVEMEPHLLGAKAVRAWAMILNGMRTWNAVCLITRICFLFADLLEQDVLGTSSANI